MSSSVPALDERPRLVAIVAAGLIGFLAGQILAALLEALGVALTHYPGGVNALNKATNPPVVGERASDLLAYGRALPKPRSTSRIATDDSRAWPDQWRPCASDRLYVLLGVACQFAAWTWPTTPFTSRVSISPSTTCSRRRTAAALW